MKQSVRTAIIARRYLVVSEFDSIGYIIAHGGDFEVAKDYLHRMESSYNYELSGKNGLEILTKKLMNYPNYRMDRDCWQSLCPCIVEYVLHDMYNLYIIDTTTPGFQIAEFVFEKAEPYRGLLCTFDRDYSTPIRFSRFPIEFLAN